MFARYNIVSERCQDNDHGDSSDGGKWGYIDKHGNWVVEPSFDGAKPFEGGLARVKVGTKWGYINRSGAYVWEPTE